MIGCMIGEILVLLFIGFIIFICLTILTILLGSIFNWDSDFLDVSFFIICILSLCTFLGLFIKDIFIDGYKVSFVEKYHVYTFDNNTLYFDNGGHIYVKRNIDGIQQIEKLYLVKVLRSNTNHLYVERYRRGYKYINVVDDYLFLPDGINFKIIYLKADLEDYYNIIKRIKKEK